MCRFYGFYLRELAWMTVGMLDVQVHVDDDRHTFIDSLN